MQQYNFNQTLPIPVFLILLTNPLQCAMDQGVRWQEIIEGATFSNNDVMMMS